MQRFTRSIALVLAAAVGAAGNATAQGFGSIDTLWVQPAEQAGGTPGCSRLVLADLPPYWLTGDAAAVLMGPSAGPLRDRLQPRLLEALLQEEAAVLDFPAGRSDAECPGRAAPPLAEVFGAIDALAVQAGAGLIVAIGLGSYGDAVLAAAEEAAAAAVLGPRGPRMAAAIAIDAPGRARFAMGRLPHAVEDWPARAPLLCAAIAGAAGLEGPADCIAALTPPQAQASLRPPP